MKDARQSAMRRLGACVYWGQHLGKDELKYLVKARPGDTARVMHKEYVYVETVSRGRPPVFSWTRTRGRRDEND